MLILRRIAPAVALLVALFVTPLPTAQSMVLKTTGTPHKVAVKYSKVPLSTNTRPSVIRSKVYKAWRNKEFRWSDNEQWYCFDQIVKHESGWDPWSTNGMGWEETGGIPQAHPSRKMREAGRDYRTNVWTQVRWGLNYIRSAYGSPCNAWSRWQDRAGSGSYGWY